MLLGIQLIGLFFGLFMLYLTFLYSKRNEFTRKEWAVWSGLWVIFLVLSIFPGLLDPLLEPLSLYRTMDFFISLGFMFFIAMIFYVYSIVRSNQNKVLSIVQEIAYIKEKMKPIEEEKNVEN